MISNDFPLAEFGIRVMISDIGKLNFSFSFNFIYLVKLKLKKSMTILMIILNVVPQPSILILVRHRLRHRLEPRNISNHMFQGYVNFTRILFTLSFISCIVCFVFGCLAYSNRERRIWYKTLGKTCQKSYLIIFTKFSIVFKSTNILKGWILIAISLVTLISLIIFPG